MPTPATFYTVSSFPYSQLVTQADFNAGSHSGGVANEVWFKYVLTSALALGCYSTIGGTFNYRVDFFESDALTDRGHNLGAAGWFAAQNVTNYWIRVRRNPAGASDFDFTVHLDSASLAPVVQPGDYLVNDDEAGFPSTVVAPDGTFRGFVDAVPSGEMVSGLLSGHVLVHDRFGKYAGALALFDPTLALISSFDLPVSITSGFPNLTENGIRFYVGHPNVRNVYSVDSGGVVTLVASAITGSGSFNAIGVNPDGTILYYVDGGDPAKIKRYDLVGAAPLSDLYNVGGSAVIGRTAINSHPGELVVLSDGTVAAYYQDTGVSVLIFVSAAGSLLHSYSVSSAVQSYDHIARAPDDPTSLNVWSFLATDDNGRFRHFNVATGAADETFDQELFSAGENRNAATAVMFGPSSSCGFTTLLSSEAPGAGGTDSGGGGSSTIDSCCDHPAPGTTPPGGGNVGTNPNPVGTLPPWMASCTGGGDVDSVADLSDGELWL